MSAPDLPPPAPPFDPVLPTPAKGGCYELDPGSGELTREGGELSTPPEDPETPE